MKKGKKYFQRSVLTSPRACTPRVCEMWIENSFPFFDTNYWNARGINYSCVRYIYTYTIWKKHADFEKHYNIIGKRFLGSPCFDNNIIPKYIKPIWVRCGGGGPLPILYWVSGCSIYITYSVFQYHFWINFFLLYSV